MGHNQSNVYQTTTADMLNQLGGVFICFINGMGRLVKNGRSQFPDTQAVLPLWLRMLYKLSDLVFKLSPGSWHWLNLMRKPLFAGILIPLLSRNPWTL